jgi:hypothetical protein
VSDLLPCNWVAMPLNRQFFIKAEFSGASMDHCSARIRIVAA